MRVLYTVSQKTSPCYILNNLAKDRLVYIILRKFHIRKVWTRPLHLNNVVALPCEEQLIWRCFPDIVDNTDDTSSGSCQSHPLITGEDYYTLCFKKNGHPFHFCDYSVCYWPIFKIYGNIASKKICNKTQILYWCVVFNCNPSKKTR